MTFKLLRVPYLVRKNVLQSMGFIDLFIIANTSQLMTRIVKRDVKLRNHEIFARIGESIQIAFINMKEMKECATIVIQPIEKFRLELPIGKPGADFISVFHKNKPLLETFWMDQFDGAKKAFKAVTEIFGEPFKDAQIDLDGIKQGYQDILGWMNGWSEPLADIKFKGDKCDADVFEWIVEHTTASNNILIASQKITNETIKKCLLKLKSGSNSKLKELNLEIYRDADLPAILSQVTKKGELIKERDGWSFRLDNGDKCSVCNIEFEDLGEIIDGVEILIKRE